MIVTYLKQAMRGLVTNRGYSALNILGLSSALACFAFIALWVKDEYSYDRFNTNYDRIVRVTGTAKTASGISKSAVSSAPMAKALQNDYPEIEQTVRFDMNGDAVVKYGEQEILEENILFTDPSFFEVFNFRLLTGDQAKALAQPYSVVLTESTAKKYFGNSNPLGQVISMKLYDSGANGALYKVTGVIADAPSNSHFRFNILGSFSTAEVRNPDILTVDGWGDASYYTYLLLKEGVDQAAFSKKIALFYGKYIGEQFDSWKSIYSYQLQPLRDIHLRSKLEFEITPNGNIANVYIFSTVGIFILLLAAINYVNLSAARSVVRAKEAVIRKVVGASRKQLVAQHIVEAVLTSLLALVFALLLCYLFQPLFSNITGKELLPLSSPVLILFLGVVAILLGILAGLYPAALISAYKPTKVLKGSLQTGRTGVLVRKSLVVAQFVVTIVLITGIVVITTQMSFIKNKDLGFNKTGLLFLRVHGNENVMSGYAAFRGQLLSNPLIHGVTTSNSLPVSGLSTGGSESVDAQGNSVQINTARLRIDPDYLGVYNIPIIAGRNLRSTDAADTLRPVILNEAAIKKLGWNDAQTAIGKPFRISGQSGQVVAVVRNFHFNSLQNLIEPLAIYPRTNNFSRITVKVDFRNVKESISWLQKTWKQHYPSALLDYGFLDKQLGEQYAAEEKFSKIFFYFSVLSLLIACLGLYGLISFAAAQKTKEIGIRKVLGGTIAGITLLLSRDFVKLVMWAFIIAIPVTLFIMNRWLRDFAYRTSITWWMFAGAGLAVLIIAMLTVSSRAIIAASANPARSLKNE